MNITNMAIVGVFTGYSSGPGRCGGSRQRSRGGLVAVAFTAAFVNTVVASLAFVVEYALGGAGGAPSARCSPSWSACTH